MGLRPVFLNPRTLVRAWGTRTEWYEWKSGYAGDRAQNLFVGQGFECA